MDKVRLGRTGLMVSRIGYGGIPIQRVPEEDAIAVVQRCLGHGINFIDTANSYTTSEERIGKAIKKFNRKDLIIATKSSSRDADKLAEHLAKSLKRLDTDYIDIYQFHGVNDDATLEKVLDPAGPMKVVQKALKDGVIKHLGISCHAKDTAIKAIKSGKFETLMFPFNFVTNEPGEEILPLCRQYDVGFIAMKPLAGGMLDNVPVACKYLLQFPDVVPLIGIEKTAEIDEIVGIANKSWRLTPSEKKELDRMKNELGKEFCRRCDYCQPCPAGIGISSVMVYAGFEKRMPAKTVFEGWVAPLMEKVYDCQDCGDCEERCPFKLPIRRLTKQYADRFKTNKQDYLKRNA